MMFFNDEYGSFNSDGFIDDLPMRNAVWNAAVSKNLSIEQNRFRCDFAPDFGGNGVLVKFENSISVESVKCNNIESANFYPKCCCLPLISHWDHWNQQLPNVNKVELFPNSSCLHLDENISCILYTDVNRRKVIIREFVENECEMQRQSVPSVFEVVENSVEYDDFDEECGLIREVMKTVDIYDSNISIVKQDNCLTFIEIEKNDENEIIANTICDIDSSKIDETESLFLFTSMNNAIAGFVAIAGQVGVEMNRRTKGFVKEFDINEEKITWQSTPEAGFNSSIGIHSTLQPRVVAYGEARQFGMVDLRVRNCFTAVIKPEKIGTINAWETFKLVSSNPTLEHQHLIATDCHLCVYDVRFAKNIVYQWSHTINSEDSLNYLKSSGKLICDISSNSGTKSHVIAISNDCDICLFTTQSIANDSINQKSLHHPLHVSQPSDCYHFSYTGDGDIYEHIKGAKLIGLDVCASKCGFSVFQLTNKGDVFVQDFYHKDFVDECDKSVLDYSWRYSTAPEELKLNDEVIEYIVDAFKPNEAAGLSMNAEATVAGCKCCELGYVLRENNFFGPSNSDMIYISNGEIVNVELRDPNDIRLRRKKKNIVKPPIEGCTPDDYLRHLMDTFMPEDKENAQKLNDSEQMEDTEQVEDLQLVKDTEVAEEIQQSNDYAMETLKTKILNLWMEGGHSFDEL